MRTTQTIITGSASRHTEIAIEWLKAHGAVVTAVHGLSLIILPGTMELRHDTLLAWRYTVSVKADEHEGDSVEIEAHADPYEIEFRLERA